MPKLKLFYGWYMVVAWMLLATYNSLIFVYGWTAFVNPIIATFGWSMAQLSLASSLRSLETGIFNPLFGFLVDRWSPRKLMLSGVLVAGLGTFLMSQIRTLAMYYGGFLLVGLGTSLVTGILPITVIARWFKRDIGKANGLFYMGMAIGGVLVPLVVTLIDTLSWQTTLMYAAFGFLALGIPLSFIIRSRPADYGLIPDGRVTDARKGSRQDPAEEFGTGVKEALKMRAFWHICIIILFQSATLSTVTLYLIPYLTSLGLARSTASTVMMSYSLVSLFGRPLFGTLSDIFRKSYVVAASITLLGAGLLVYRLMGGTSPFWFILLFAIVYGLGLSGVTALRPPFISEYFGTKNFGTIFGFISIFMSLASITSPPLAGWIYDSYTDYKLWWTILIGLAIVALVSVLTIPAAKKGRVVTT